MSNSSWDWVRHIPSMLSVVKHVTTRNILSGPITLCAIVTPLAMLLALIAGFSESARALAPYFLVIAVAPVLWVMFQNGYWTFAGPDRLHDERTQTAWRKLTYGDNRHEGPVIDAEPTSNPQLPKPNPKLPPSTQK